MARKYEGSAKDRAEDARGAKATGKSLKAYESSARDRAEDAAGERAIKVKPHVRRPPAPRGSAPAAPQVGPNVFDAGQEQAMRQGQRQANMAPPDNDGDEGIGEM